MRNDRKIYIRVIELLRKKSLRRAINEPYAPNSNIRNEFRSLFNARCNNVDKPILKEFLSLPYNEGISDLAIRNCDTEKFKPLYNFLQKGVKTHEKNMELLAWLIDFRPRSFSNYWRLANGKADVLSGLAITESGIVVEIKEKKYTIIGVVYLKKRGNM
ncbi:MAG: hypothetical protein EOO20_23830 [Chryseobacterium sp.]|nr:MAG: hypothetical protein EOO20_23830 [Chryseobacterium sp.]